MSTKLTDDERPLNVRHFGSHDTSQNWSRLVFVLCVLGLVCGVTAAVVKHLMM